MSELSTRKKHSNKFKDISGQPFGKWTVLKYAGSNGRAYWLCRCECGNECEVGGKELRNGHSTQCKRCQARQIGSNPKHGHAKSGNKKASRTYRSWECMIDRCTNRKHKAYKNYGGRGITVCDRWRNSFENFLADMGMRPEGMTIDRIENDGNYEPGNCRWATLSQQRRNQRKRKK